MCACLSLCRILRQVVRLTSRRSLVVTVQSKVIAEDSPIAHCRRIGEEVRIESGELVYKDFDFHVRHPSLTAQDLSVSTAAG